MRVWVVAALLSFSCASARAAPKAPKTDAVWDYRVHLEGEDLLVEATLPSCGDLKIEDEGEDFVADVSKKENGSSCALSYRFHLLRAGKERDDPMEAIARNGAVIAPPSTWLLHPDETDGAQFRLVVDPKTHAVLGLDPSSHTYSASMIWKSPLAVFGEFREKRIEVGGSAIEVAITPGDFEDGDAVVLQWISEAAKDVAAYYGRFPVPRVLEIVLPSGGGELGFATTLGNGGASIISPVGRGIDAKTLARDWQMTHEMIHLGLPNLARRHHWLEEGIATYVEPFARARRGRLAPDTLWRDVADGLPKGQPERGDRGLDNTHTWGRTYWGGALFCFAADYQIRTRTKNTRSLDDALRAILEAGGDIRVDWPIEQVIEVGDRATGTHVLAELYKKMADAPAKVDVEGMFSQLGVKKDHGSIALDDRAPLAWIRRSMTATVSGTNDRTRARAN